MSTKILASVHVNILTNMKIDFFWVMPGDYLDYTEKINEPQWGSFNKLNNKKWN